MYCVESNKVIFCIDLSQVVYPNFELCRALCYVLGLKEMSIMDNGSQSLSV